MSKRKGQSTVRIYPDWCKGCGICVAFCPVKVFELQMDGKSHVVREEECINCGFCELHCPDFAVSVTPKGASRRKDDGRVAMSQSPPEPPLDSGIEQELRPLIPNQECNDGHEKA